MTQADVMQRRVAGVLLHPTCLPGPHGSGDLGPNAYYFVDWLHNAGQTLWQTLPLGPVGSGNSPYMGSSAFAGNPLLVAFEPMVQAGWIASDAVAWHGDDAQIDFESLIPWRMGMLRECFAGFLSRADEGVCNDFSAWRLTQADWAADYALFMTLDQAFAPAAWPQWPSGLARRHEGAMSQARLEHAGEMDFWCFVQWQFDVQWQHLKTYAKGKGISLVGDVPIFVAHHSADCWARPDLYLLNADGEPEVVAGVPPDFFSETGQRWGNPLYNWKAMQADGYRWWIARFKRQLQLADVLRIDHFRGFAGYWEIPAQEPTAVKGRWMPGPGISLFEAIEEVLGKLPVIAEDLGVITADVVDLRERAGFPGMRVLQFAFAEDAGNAFLPHNYVPDTVVYVGTHDNDTVQGWWAHCSATERAYAGEYLAADGADVHWAMIRVALQSVAHVALYQLQDVMGLDGSHRMNTPGSMGCWTWRFKWDWITEHATQRLARMTAASARADFSRLR
jgi:4-alpha-glucanotransferase